jgi:hypothetical protein
MSTAKRKWTAFLYWTGVATTLACLALVPAGNTDPVWHFEHRGFPLSWALAGAAVIAFLAAEFFHSVWARPTEAEAPSLQLATEWANPKVDPADA